jgi:hypothetical protein
MPAPDQHRLAGVFIDQINQPQPLPDRESLRNNGQAAFGAHVHCIALSAQCPPIFFPLDRNRDSRIEPRRCPQLLHPGLETNIVRQGHSRLLSTTRLQKGQPRLLLCHSARQSSSQTPNLDTAARLRTSRAPVNGTSRNPRPRSNCPVRHAIGGDVAQERLRLFTAQLTLIVFTAPPCPDCTHSAPNCALP